MRMADEAQAFKVAPTTLTIWGISARGAPALAIHVSAYWLEGRVIWFHLGRTVGGAIVPVVGGWVGAFWVDMGVGCDVVLCVVVYS